MNTLPLDLLARLSKERATRRPRAGTEPAPLRLPVPQGFNAPLGHDAVGVDAAYGERIRRSLPRVGCIYAQRGTWWWLVPAQAEIGLDWRPVADYSVGALIAPERGDGDLPRLLHLPKDTVPYTHPLLLYIAACRAVGVEPVWSKP